MIRRLTGPTTQVMAVIKANAYGHGSPEIAVALAREVEMFGVANVTEARAVLNALPKAEIFILGTALPCEREEIVSSGFIPCISSLDEAERFHELGGTEPVRVHLTIDTGMGRMGVWQDDVLEVARELIQLPRLKIVGIATHLPSADEDVDYTANQLDRFSKIIGQLRDLGITAPLIHSLNSAGVIRFGSLTNYVTPAQDGAQIKSEETGEITLCESRGMVRTGLMLYGVSPIPGFQNQLRPVMTLKTRVILVRTLGPGRTVSYGGTFVTTRTTRVATLAIGYADGYPRNLSGHEAVVLIQGHRCPVLGRVTMDQIMVDVTELNEIIPGDEAVLIGRQGESEVFASDLAEKAGIIVWELFTGLKGRVERIYLHRAPGFEEN